MNAADMLYRSSVGSELDVSADAVVERAKSSSLASIFEYMRDGIMVVDMAWNILFANSMARKILSLSKDHTHVAEHLIPLLSKQFVLSTEFDQIESIEENSIAFEATGAAGLPSEIVYFIYLSRPNEHGLRFVLLQDVTDHMSDKQHARG